MRFPYWMADDDGEQHWLPLVPVTAYGPQDTLENALALVDSGAEHNVFGMAVARQLGIDVSTGRGVEIVGVAGSHSSGQLVNVDLQLNRHRWTAPVVFSEAVEHDMLLGQRGFFAFFTVRFRYSQRLMDIQRARSRGAFAVPHFDHDPTL